MDKEIQAAVAVIASFVSRGLDEERLLNFSDELSSRLGKKCEGHYYNNPAVGSAYRSLLCAQGKPDACIYEAAVQSGCAEDVCRLLPSELIVWIDPGNVAYRVGIEGSVCDIAITDSYLEPDAYSIEAAVQDASSSSNHSTGASASDESETSHPNSPMIDRKERKPRTRRRRRRSSRRSRSQDRGSVSESLGAELAAQLEGEAGQDVPVFGPPRHQSGQPQLMPIQESNVYVSYEQQQQQQQLEQQVEHGGLYGQHPPSPHHHHIHQHHSHHHHNHHQHHQVMQSMQRAEHEMYTMTYQHHVSMAAYPSQWQAGPVVYDAGSSYVH